MSGSCMPGMPMPGCGNGRPVGTMPFSLPSELALALCLLLSAYALTVALLSIGQWAGGRSCAPHRVDVLSTVDHVTHAGGMIAMVLWMAGAFTFEPTWPYLALYSLAGCVFLIRLKLRPNLDGRLRELWHVLANGSMVYMLSGADLTFVTIGCLALFVFLMLITVGSRHRVLFLPPPLSPRSDLHLTAGLAMVVMLAMMQWSSWLRW